MALPPAVFCELEGCRTLLLLDLLPSLPILPLPCKEGKRSCTAMQYLQLNAAKFMCQVKKHTWADRKKEEESATYHAGPSYRRATCRQASCTPWPQGGGDVLEGVYLHLRSLHSGCMHCCRCTRDVQPPYCLRHICTADQARTVHRLTSAGCHSAFCSCPSHPLHPPRKPVELASSTSPRLSTIQMA